MSVFVIGLNVSSVCEIRTIQSLPGNGFSCSQWLSGSFVAEGRSILQSGHCRVPQETLEAQDVLIWRSATCSTRARWDLSQGIWLATPCGRWFPVPESLGRPYLDEVVHSSISRKSAPMAPAYGLT